MADKLDDGAAYLAALKRTSPSSQGTAAAPARAHEGEGESDNPVAGTPHPTRVEKRQSPRYKCQGSAHLQEFDGATSVWATLTDISLHGCYVESASTFHVGTILSLRLEANGFRIDASGEVHVAYPGLGMGISFSRMLEKDRERLRELVRATARPSVVLSQPNVARPPSAPKLDMWRAVANPAAALQAIFTFFEDRHMMGREEFLRIVRNSQGNGT